MAEPKRAPCVACGGVGSFPCWTSDDDWHCQCWQEGDEECCRCGYTGTDTTRCPDNNDG